MNKIKLLALLAAGGIPLAVVALDPVHECVVFAVASDADRLAHVVPSLHVHRFRESDGADLVLVCSEGGELAELHAAGVVPEPRPEGEIRREVEATGRPE